MKLLNILLPLQVVLVSLVAHGTQSVNGEQPSTLFVLDTSDSDPAPISSLGGHSAPADSTADSNTRTVSDEPVGSSSQKQYNNQSNHQRPTTGVPSTLTHSQQQQHEKRAPVAAAITQSSREHSQAPVTSRRLEEPAHMAPASQQHHQSQSQQQKNYRTTTTTTASPYDQGDQNVSVPKSEERLLISITSEDPDEPYKKVSTSNQNGGYDEPQTLSVPGGNSQQVHHHQKRKPSITISIQDANINKQNGGSGGTQAVIVRPGEDGQSIVIATVSSSSVNNNNKYKPPPQTSVSDNIPISINQQQQPQRPYQEPVNNPIQAIVAQHHITSTTRRPPINDYNSQPLNNNNQNRPITSTLVDQQRPPAQLTDERPQRPISDDRPNNQGAYETPRPNNAHVRPTQEPYSSNNGHMTTSSSHNNNNNQDVNEPLTSYDQFQGSSSSGEEQRRYPLNEKNCGIMHETRIVGGDVADPDDFMWMAAIIKSKPNNGEPRPFCGGSLITRRHILTAAHCLEGLAPRDVLVRLGSYDFEDSASSSSADYAIDQFRVPAQYSRKTHVADLAIMRLKTPLSPNDQYKTVCMPQARRSYVGAYGLVTGYGSQSQTFRKAAPKLRQVTVPIWENRECSKVYNKTMGDSFLCAGYEAGGKDACQGDSGGPIMTEGPSQKMMIVGVVSHGIGCGSPGYPGVYTRTTTFADWIEKNTKE